MPDISSAKCKSVHNLCYANRIDYLLFRHAGRDSAKLGFSEYLVPAQHTVVFVDAYKIGVAACRASWEMKLFISLLRNFAFRLAHTGCQDIARCANQVAGRRVVGAPS